MKRTTRLMAACLSAVVSSGAGCGSGEECSGAACVDQGWLEAGTPNIGNSTWTVTVCQNSDCASAEITSSDANKAANGLTMQYAQGAGGWKLGVRKLAHSPKNGDVWSLRITDQSGATIFDDSRPVTYKTAGDDCQSCKTVAVSF